MTDQSNDQVFVLVINGQQVWKAIVNGTVVKADFNSKGAALAAIPTERIRQARQVASKQGHAV